jgi:hypothetical protein
MTEKELLNKVEMLEDLAAKQNKALGMANGLLDLKDQLVRLCEEETEFYKRSNKRLTRSLMISAVLFAIVAVMNIIRLLL